MNDPKDTDDIITTADEQPETLIDDQLDTVDGALGYQLTNAHVTGISLGGLNSETIYAGAFADTIYAGSAVDFGTTDLFGGVAALRKRPGRTKY